MVDVRRHVPRIVLTWDDEVPGARWRTLDGTLSRYRVSGPRLEETPWRNRA